MGESDFSVSLRITGRVQGVGYRVWMQREAVARGLSGWAKNEPGGAVAGLASGPEAAVRDLIKALRQGPPGARVESVEVHPALRPLTAGFTIRA